MYSYYIPYNLPGSLDGVVWRYTRIKANSELEAVSKFKHRLNRSHEIFIDRIVRY